MNTAVRAHEYRSMCNS